MVCGHYRLTPAVAGSLTPAELRVMLDGLDWTEDRQWERAMLPMLERRGSQDLLDLRYPHFRTDPVVEIISPDDDEAPPRAKTFKG